MQTIKVKVSEYYGIPNYYSVMPEEIFNALEEASLNGKEYADLDKNLFDIMIAKYQQKAKQ